MKPLHFYFLFHVLEYWEKTKKKCRSRNIDNERERERAKEKKISILLYIVLYNISNYIFFVVGKIKSYVKRGNKKKKNLISRFQIRSELPYYQIEREKELKTFSLIYKKKYDDDKTGKRKMMKRREKEKKNIYIQKSTKRLTTLK